MYNLFLLFVKNKRLNLIPLPEISKEYMDKNNNISNIQFVAPVDLDEKGKVKKRTKLKQYGNGFSKLIEQLMNH